LGTQRVSAAVVVNCTWESRAKLDAGFLSRAIPMSIRYKYALFGKGLRHCKNLAPSTRITGRFGDVTPYGNGQAFLSWYPAGLAGLSDDGTLPEVKAVDPERMTREILAGLGLDRTLLEEPEASWEVSGGYIVAHGFGDIDRLDSPLHERDRPGAYEIAPGYISVDTGKYSLGPLMALRAVELVRRYFPRGGREVR
jgi:hypothetical protein